MKRGRPETVPGIIKLIHRERDRLRHRGDLQNSPTSSKETYADIDVILLSGGLGSSDYIKYKIEESLRDGVNGVTASMPKVCTLTEPQNCICRGLLEDRMLGLWRAGKCNGSYGLLEKEPYRRTKPKHMLARLSKHLSVNGDKKFVEQVKWLIRKVRESCIMISKGLDVDSLLTGNRTRQSQSAFQSIGTHFVARIQKNLSSRSSSPTIRSLQLTLAVVRASNALPNQVILTMFVSFRGLRCESTMR